MNKYKLVCIGLCLTIVAHAQTVAVKKSNEKIKGEDAEGFYTELEGKKEVVGNAWTKFAKDIGKTRLVPTDPFTITEPTIGGTLYEKGILYMVTKERPVTKEKGETTMVWLGLKPGEWVVNDISIVNRELEKLVHQFGIKYYRDKIQVLIDEAQRAVDAVERQKQRLTNQTKDYVMKVGSNEQEKVQLEKSLEVNKLEHAVLLQKIENNKKSQDSIAVAGEQIKKALELQREKQRKVN
jgi:hypothetical protein